MAKGDYDEKKGKGMGCEGMKDTSQPDSKRPWDVPQGMPDPPGKTTKIDRG